MNAARCLDEALTYCFAQMLAFKQVTTPSMIALSPSVNLPESAICFIVTASAMLIADPTISTAAFFFCSPVFAPNIASVPWMTPGINAIARKNSFKKSIPFPPHLNFNDLDYRRKYSIAR
jgi:hypothetical protein